MSRIELKKIIWPIDAFDENRQPALHMTQVLRALTSRLDVTIQPVYVMSPAKFGLLLGFWPDWQTPYRPIVEKNLSATLKEVKLEGLLPPKLISEPSQSTRAAVRTLLKFADDEDADLIAVSTHARKGLSRLFLGSFAETLLLHSRVPILTANPAVRPPKKFDRIFFPTDFSRASKPAFERVCILARAIHAKLTVYHRFPTVYLPEAVILPESYGVYEKGAFENQRKRGEKWAQKARLLGLQADVVIDTKVGMHSDAIVKQSKASTSQIITMSPERGPVESMLMGSITRQVVRHATCPVWILHRKTGKSL